MKKVLWLILLGLILFSGTIYADTLELVNGKKIEGAFVGRSNGSIRFEVDGITSTYDEKDVKNITFGALRKKRRTQRKLPRPLGPQARRHLLLFPPEHS